MRLGFRCLLLMVALLTLPTSAAAQVPTGPAISVTGEAEVKVVPDEVVLSVGVETGDKILKAAKDLNDERVRRAIGVARRHGVQAEHIQTDYISIEPRHRGHEVINELLGYVVRKTIVIRLKDVARFESLLSDLLEAGVNHVHGVEFRTTELRKHRDQARLLAIRAAREKAELLAREAGRQLGRASSIGEGSYGWWSNYGSWWGNRWGGGMAQNVVQNAGGASPSADGTLAPGQIAVRASVSVTFSLE